MRRPGNGRTVTRIIDERGQMLPLVAVAMLLIAALFYAGLLLGMARADRARNQGVADVLALSASLSLCKDSELVSASVALARARSATLEASYRAAAAATRESTGTGSEFFRLPFSWERQTAYTARRLELEAQRGSAAADARARQFVSALARRYYRDRSWRLSIAGTAAGDSGDAVLEELRSRLDSYETRISIIRERLIVATAAYGAAKQTPGADVEKSYADFKLFRSSLGGLTAARNRVAERLVVLENALDDTDGGGKEGQALLVAVGSRGRLDLPFFQGSSPLLALAAARPRRRIGGESALASILADMSARGIMGPEAARWFADAVSLTRGLRPVDHEMAKLLPYFAAPMDTVPGRRVPVLVSVGSVRGLLGSDAIDWLSASKR